LKLNLDISSDLHPEMEKDFPFICCAAQRLALAALGRAWTVLKAEKTRSQKND